MSGIHLPYSQLNTSTGGGLEQEEGMRPFSVITHDS